MKSLVRAGHLCILLIVNFTVQLRCLDWLLTAIFTSLLLLRMKRRNVHSKFKQENILVFVYKMAGLWRLVVYCSLEIEDNAHSYILNACFGCDFDNFWLIRFVDHPFISSLLIFSMKSWTLVCFIEHDHTHLLNILAKKKKTQRMKVDVWTLQHHKKLTKAVQERTYAFLLTNFEKWFLSCMDKDRKIHLLCSQTEIRSKWICETESPFLKPLQTEKQKNGKF